MRPHVAIAAAVAAAVLALTVAAPAAAAADEPGQVNINAATVQELAYLPRIGTVVAQRIVDYRDANGRFKSPDELMLVKGIGEKTFELLEPYVSVSGETTLTEKVRVAEQSPEDG